MTKVEIRKMAGEAGIKCYGDVRLHPESIDRFANLVAAAEREACMNCYSPDDSATDWMDKMKARSQS